MKIETEQLLLRDYTETDLHEMFRLWSDEKAMYHLDDIFCASLEETKKYLRIGIENADGHYFCICEKNFDKFIGSIGYTISETTPLEFLMRKLNRPSFVSSVRLMLESQSPITISPPTSRSSAISYPDIAVITKSPFVQSAAFSTVAV